MTARTTLATLIDRLRGMTNAGTADYSLGTANFWDGDHMQDVLDRHRTDVKREPLTMVSDLLGGGSVSYTEYRSRFMNYEATSGGSAIFIVENSTGANVGTASYSVDYQNGIVTFGANQAGTLYYLTGRSFNLNAAAADVWRQKAAHYADTKFDFSTDGHSIKRSQLVQQAMDMAERYENMGGGIQTVEMIA